MDSRLAFDERASFTMFSLFACLIGRRWASSTGRLKVERGNQETQENQENQDSKNKNRKGKECRPHYRTIELWCTNQFSLV